ncbi:GNAT family N-acetyltransferase [Lactobacillus xylocopicola]|uniref:N-acetyltransferase n=1 Tax=Lactobacillus xylocopicola TaxID=2976676 RepID=A0ABN6SNQ2_9LACO|nr:GNAT family N-acetyltransferase [Lactobacillus xylocopicola]BDR60807.1 N-acetyltransferase [Lactobacillus xylocopicola]
MEYNTSKNIDLDQLIKLYTSVGWTAYTQSPENLSAAVANSLTVITAIDAGQLVGLIRLVGDGLSIIYVQDLLVQPTYQRRGIGTQLLNLAINQYRSVRQKVLLTEEAAETRAFYEKCGFSSCDRGNLVAFYREF